jgi:hypothetical protein
MLIRALLATAGVAGVLAATHARAEEETAAKLSEAFTKGKVSLALRYRVETVSDGAFADDAYASTLRTALAFRTLPWRRFAGFVEFQNVADLGFEDSHNKSGAGAYANGVTGRPSIADPDITRVQQFGIRSTWIPRTAVSAGRHEIVLGNERLVGAVGFRQNHQAFDSLRVDVKPADPVRLTYAYLDRVHTATGASKGMGTHALHGEVDVADAGTAAFYALWLDYSAAADAALSSGTWGAQWRGSVPLSETWKLSYHAEWANQADAGDNPTSYDASYLFVEAGTRNDHFDVRAGYEQLGSDAGVAAFSTPVATLSKFNGWADKFTTTPVAGLEDLYLSMAYTRGPWTAILVGHHFSPDASGADYGNEIDGRIEWKASWKQIVGFQWALYNAEGLSTDTNKLWLYTSWGF